MAAISVLNQDTQMVVFILGDEAYCIDIFRVHEIIRLKEITPIPGSASHVRGLLNLRGKTIPIIDLRTRFLLELQDTDSSRIIVVETEGGNVGIVVDGVREVITLSPSEVDETPEMVDDATRELVRGVAKRGEQLVTLLDLDQVIAQ